MKHSNIITAETLLIEELKNGRTLKERDSAYYLAGSYFGHKKQDVDSALAQRVINSNRHVVKLPRAGRGWVWRD
jgi:hypothetical protein